MSSLGNKNSPDSRDYIQDPDLPLDQAEGLSDGERQTAQRQRYLDERLKSAMAEVHARVDSRQPDADSFMLRLQNSIEAIDREAGAAARKKAESDAGAYLGKIAWRRRVDWLRERFVFSENHGMRIAAALGVAVIALVPVMLSQSGGVNQNALTEAASDDAAHEAVAMADAPVAASGASGPELTAAAEAALAEEPAEDLTAGADAASGEPRLATAPGPLLDDAPPEIPEDLSGAGDTLADTGEVVASRATAKLAKESADEPRAAAAPPQIDSTSLQIEILSARLKQAKSADEKLVILRGLRSLYSKAGKAGKVQEVDRQIESLK